MTDITVERSRLQIVVLAVLALCVVLFGVLTAVSRHRPGIVSRDALLRMEEDGKQTVFSGKAEGQPVTVIRTEESGGAVGVELTAGTLYHAMGWVEPDPDAAPKEPVTTGVTVTLNDREIFRGGYYEGDSFRMLFTPDGELDMDFDVTFTNGNHDPWENYELSAGAILGLAYDEPDTRQGSWAYYALAVFCTFLLALDVAFPLTLFRLQYRFSVRNPEPTEFYMTMQKISWGVLTAFLLAGYVAALQVLS